MIQRRRSPDGSVHDIDHGPGPVGRLSMPGHRYRSIGGAPVAQSTETQMPKLGLTAERNARHRDRKAAR